MSNPHIIRTDSELRAIDSEALLTDRNGEVMSAQDYYETGEFPLNEDDRLAVIATGETVRAAKEALEKA